MEYTFLENFNERMEAFSLSYFLTKRCEIKKDIWKEMKLLELDEEPVNLVFSVLVYLCEKTYDFEEVTFDDILYFVKGILIHKEGVEYTDEKIEELTKSLIEDVLQNGGKIMTFNAYNYEKESYDEIPVRFIETQRSLETEKVIYNLTSQGYKLVFATLELQQKAQIDYQSYVSHKQIERNDYVGAIQTFRSINITMIAKIRETDELIKAIKNNVFQVPFSEYKAMVDELQTTFTEEHEHFREERVAVEEKIKEVQARETEEEKSEKEKKKDLKYLKEIHKLLGKITTLGIMLNDKLNELMYEYGNELKDTLINPSNESFSFKNEIYNKCIDNPNNFKVLDEVLHGLFFKDYLDNKIYNPALSLEFIGPNTDEFDAITIDDIGELALREKRLKEKQEKLRILKLYQDSLGVIIDKTWRAPGHKIDLQTLVDHLNRKELSVLAPEAYVIKNIIIELARSPKIDVASLRKEHESHVLSETYNFYVKKEVFEVIKNNERYNDIVSLDVEIIDDPDQKVNIDVVLTPDVITCNNLIFRLNKEKK